jgi:hypothetical protein
VWARGSGLSSLLDAMVISCLVIGGLVEHGVIWDGYGLLLWLGTLPLALARDFAASRLGLANYTSTRLPYNLSSFLLWLLSMFGVRVQR